MVTIGALEESLRVKKWDLETELEKRKGLLQQFDVLRKCLQILLDETLCRMVIHEDSIISGLTENYACPNDDMADLTKTLEQIQELCETGDQPEFLVKELQKLAKQGSSSSHDDAYYESGETAVEELIDSFMLRHAPDQAARTDDYGHDYLVLLRQMEDMNPISQG